MQHGAGRRTQRGPFLQPDTVPQPPVPEPDPSPPHSAVCASLSSSDRVRWSLYPPSQLHMISPLVPSIVSRPVPEACRSWTFHTCPAWARVQEQRPPAPRGDPPTCVHTSHTHTHTPQSTCTHTQALAPTLRAGGLGPPTGLSGDWLLPRRTVPTQLVGMGPSPPSCTRTLSPPLLGGSQGSPRVRLDRHSVRVSKGRAPRVPQHTLCAAVSPRALQGSWPGPWVRCPHQGSRAARLTLVTSHPQGHPRPSCRILVSVSEPRCLSCVSRLFVTSGGVRPAPPRLWVGSVSSSGQRTLLCSTRWPRAPTAVTLRLLSVRTLEKLGQCPLQPHEDHTQALKLTDTAVLRKIGLLPKLTMSESLSCASV